MKGQGSWRAGWRYRTEQVDTIWIWSGWVSSTGLLASLDPCSIEWQGRRIELATGPCTACPWTSGQRSQSSLRRGRTLYWWTKTTWRTLKRKALFPCLFPRKQPRECSSAEKKAASEAEDEQIDLLATSIPRSEEYQWALTSSLSALISQEMRADKWCSMYWKQIYWKVALWPSLPLSIQCNYLVIHLIRLLQIHQILASMPSQHQNHYWMSCSMVLNWVHEYYSFLFNYDSPTNLWNYKYYIWKVFGFNELQ